MPLHTRKNDAVCREETFLGNIFIFQLDFCIFREYIKVLSYPNSVGVILTEYRVLRDF